MEPWARDLLDAYRAAVPELSQSLLDSVEKDPARKGMYKLEDTLQIIQGGYAMVAEYLEQGTTEIRDAYVGTVIPGIMSQGETLSTLVSQSVYSQLLSSFVVVIRTKPEHQLQVGAFFSWFWMGFQREQLRSALESLRLPASLRGSTVDAGK